MTNDNTNRRDVLRGIATGVAATGLASTAAANSSGRKIVGLAADAPLGLARDAANEVTQEMDFDHAGKALAGKFPERAVAALQKHPKVRYVEDDGTMQALSETLPWGIDRVDADLLHLDREKGDGADIAIIDTGIDADHPDLQANVGTGKDFTGSGGWNDDNGHGTHCAGIAAAVDDTEGTVGVAPYATLHAAKVLSSGGSGTYSDIAAGIEWVADQGYDVGSLSLGGPSGSSALNDAVQYAQNNGVLLIGAAGNGGPCSDCVGYPAKYPEVMAVSSTDSNDDLSGSSSTGPEVEIAAPGTDIYSTYAGGGYATLSGTSMATPHVAGTGGHLMARGLSNDAARDDITITAEDLGLGSNESGAGLLDAHAAFDRRIPSVTTDGGAPGPGSITMHGELHDFGAGANSADVWFEWGFSSGNLLGATSKQSLSSPGQFSATVSGLRDGDTLYFKAVAEAADGDRDEGVVNLRTTLMPKH